LAWAEGIQSRVSVPLPDPRRCDDWNHDHALGVRRHLCDHRQLGAVVDRRDQDLLTGRDGSPLRERRRQLAFTLALHRDHALWWDTLGDAQPDEPDLRAQLAELVLDSLGTCVDLFVLAAARLHLGLRRLLRLDDRVVRQCDLTERFESLRVAQIRPCGRLGGDRGSKLCGCLLVLAFEE